ncbi:MAG: hypothetical protein RLO80_12825 [Hyphomonas sp.]
MKSLALLATRIAVIVIWTGFCLSLPALGQEQESESQPDSFVRDQPADDSMALESDIEQTNPEDTQPTEPLDGAQLEETVAHPDSSLERLRILTRSSVGVRTGTAINTRDGVIEATASPQPIKSDKSEFQMQLSCLPTDESDQCVCIQASRVLGLTQEEIIEACKDK